MDGNDTLLITDKDFDALNLLVQHYESERAHLLEEELSRATVVPQSEIPNDIVTMNSVIYFKNGETGKESKIKLVYPKDADVTKGNVSILAPVGTAVLGLRVGQQIKWPMPTGKKVILTITSVVYQPEASGDWSL